MVDLILLGLFGLFGVRGWRRGLVREALDVLTLIVGAVLAFRMAQPIGAVIVEIVDISPEVARIVGGVVAFIAISIGASIATHFLHRTIRILPGLPLLNRLGGAARRPCIRTGVGDPGSHGRAGAPRRRIGGRPCRGLGAGR